VNPIWQIFHEGGHMATLQVSEDIRDFENSPFGEKFCPWMVQSRFERGRWQPFEVLAASDIILSPAAKGLHYGSEIFEGLRAFRSSKGPVLYRPGMHARRMAHSARIVGMEPLPEQQFIESLRALVLRCESLLPVFPGSLYLRPFMMGTTSRLGAGIADDLLFLALATPFGMKLDPARPKTAGAWVSRDFVRAVPGGMGSAKVAGNYASALRAMLQAKAEGFENVLFLDALERRWIEELGGMNFFCVEDEVLRTPPLSETILAGVTRDSLLALAKVLGMRAEERPLAISDLLEGIQSGRVSEILACGTGSAVVALTRIGDTGITHQVADGNPGPFTVRLSEMLFDVQFGKAAALAPDWLISC